MENLNIFKIANDAISTIFLPNRHISNILELNIDELESRGIKNALIDIDNTVVERKYSFPEWKMKKLIDTLKAKGWNLVLLSNNSSQHRVLKVADFLELPCIYKSLKPFPWIYRKVFSDFKFSPENTVCIGDQLFMDIVGGNLCGCTTVYVDPLGPENNIFRALYIWIERLILKLLERIVQ